MNVKSIMHKIFYYTRKITHVFIPLLILLSIVYTIVLANIELAGEPEYPNIGQNIIYRSGDNYYFATGSLNRSVKLFPTSRKSSTSQWLGYSSYYGGIVILDTPCNRLQVLKFDSLKPNATVKDIAANSQFEGQWSIHNNTIHSIQSVNGVLSLFSYQLNGDSKNKTTSTPLNLPYPADDYAYNSEPSLAGDRVVFSMSSTVYLADLKNKRVINIGDGSGPVFVDDNTIAYQSTSNELTIYSIDNQKRNKIKVWKPKGLGKLPVLLPMVPHHRPDSIRKIVPLETEGKLLVEITKHNYGMSYLYLVDISKKQSTLLPFTVSRSAWSIYPAK